jgi:serine/threonine-protein kinase
VESDEEFAGRRVGRSIDQFRLERVLGVGGMAAVYAARAADGSLVAVKVLHPDVGVRGDVRERFFREGFIANHLGHPAVVRALGYGDAGPDGAYLVLELLEGETLSARVRRHGTLPPGELLGYADEILDALALAHASGIVHRDLKPENLFVTHEGRIKILDFGLARVHDALPRDHRTRSGIALGTFPYMAPEQALGRHAEIDGRTDLFALGATLFRLISGRKIHEAASEAELLMAMASKPAPSLAEVAPATQRPVVEVVDLALAYAKDARYPDARVMQGDVRAVRAGLAPPYAAQRFAEREQKTRAEPLSNPVSSSPSSVNFAPVPALLPATKPLSAPRRSKAAWPWVLASLSGLVALGSAGAFLLRGEPPLATPASPSGVALAEPRPAQTTAGKTAEATVEPRVAVSEERAAAATELRRPRAPAPRTQAAAAPSSAAPVALPDAPAVLAAPKPAAPGALETAAAGGTTSAALAADAAAEAPTNTPESKPEAAPAAASAPAPLPALRKRRPRRPIDFGD